MKKWNGLIYNETIQSNYLMKISHDYRLDSHHRIFFLLIVTNQIMESNLSVVELSDP